MTRGRVRCAVCGRDMAVEALECPWCHAENTLEKTVSFDIAGPPRDDAFVLGGGSAGRKGPALGNRSESPAEAETIRLEAAPFGRRAGAFLTDLTLVAAAALLTLSPAVALGTPPEAAAAGKAEWLPFSTLVNCSGVRGPAAGLLAALFVCYHIWFPAVLGRTPGKWLFGLRLAVGGGAGPGPMRAGVRTLGYGVSLVLLGAGFLWPLFNDDRQALHDRLAGTWVVREG